MNKNFFTSTTFKIIGYKSLVYGVALFVLAVMQTTLLARLSLFGAVPDLMLAATLTLAMHDGERTGAVAGIAAGFFCTAIGGVSSPLYMLFAFLCGYVFGIISDHALAKNFPSFFALSVFIFLAKGIFNVIDVSLFARSFNLFGTISSVVVPELFCSLLLCSPIYFIFRALARIFNKGHRERKDFVIR